MKVVLREEKVIILDGGVDLDQIRSYGGKYFLTGEFCGDPETERAYEATKNVLSEHGIRTDCDVVIILDEEWAQQIETEINESVLNA